RRYAKLRTQLYPYLAAADREYRSTGLPIMRQLALVFPTDTRANGLDDEFMFGPDLLAAPVIDKGARKRDVYLPKGDWIDVWRSAKYEDKDGSIALGKPAVLHGAGSLPLPPRMDELPLLARRGTLLALLPPDVDTLSDYGDAKGLVHIGDRAGEMSLLAWPRGDSSATFGADGEKLTSTEGSASWS